MLLSYSESPRAQFLPSLLSQVRGQVSDLSYTHPDTLPRSHFLILASSSHPTPKQGFLPILTHGVYVRTPPGRYNLTYDLRVERNVLSTEFSKALSFFFERMKAFKGLRVQAIVGHHPSAEGFMNWHREGTQAGRREQKKETRRRFGRRPLQRPPV